MSIRLRAAAATDVGNIRDNNQDDLLIIDDALFVVADGMGGHVAGEVAAREAVDAMRDAFEAPGSTDDLRQAVRLANGAVWQRGADEPSYRGMGTTVTAVAVADGDKLAIANVGDSRTYLLRGGDLLQLTQDHSFVQEAVRSGQLTRAQAESHPRRSQLTRALGVGDDVDVDIDVLEPHTGDRLLLCSDGLWDEVGDELIAMVLGGRKEPEEAASELVRWAKEAGGRDNITVIVLDVVDGGETERGVAATAALVEAGENTSAISRTDTAAVTPPADDDPARPERPFGAGSAAPVGRQDATAGWNRPVDGSLMQAGDGEPGRRSRSPRSRLVTWRVVAFLVVLLGVLAAAAVIVSRADPVWAVALDGNTVVVKEGDEIRERTPLQLNQLTPDVRMELLRGSGKRVQDRAAAAAYVDRIGLQAAQAGTLPLPDGAILGSTSSTLVGNPGGPPGTGTASTETTVGVPNGGTPATGLPGP